jgi:hypothetical protein
MTKGDIVTTRKKYKDKGDRRRETDKERQIDIER